MAASLRDRLDRVATLVYETVKAHYQDYSALHRYRLDPYEDVNALDDALNAAIHREASTSSPDSASLEPSQNPRIVQLQRMQTLSSALLLFSKTHSLVQRLDCAVDQGELLEASSSLVEMEILLHRTRELVDRECWCLLRDAFLCKKSRMQALLSELFAQMVVVQRENGVSCLKIYTMPPPIHPYSHATASTAVEDHHDWSLESVLAALETAGLLESVWPAMVEALMDLVLVPLAMDPSQALTITKLSKQLGQGISVSFGKLAGVKRDASAATEQQSSNNPSVLTEKLVQILTILRQHLLLDSKEYVRSLEKVWAPRLLAYLRTHCLEKSIPRDFQALESFQETGQELVAFERHLNELGFLTTHHDAISQFVRTLPQTFAVQKRADLLLTVREILTSNDTNTVLVEDCTERGGIRPFSVHDGGKKVLETKGNKGAGGKGGKGGSGVHSGIALKLPRFHITVITQTLVEQAYQTMIEAGKLEAEKEKMAAMELHYCVRDLFDLWRAVIPAHYKDALESDASRAALFHNDCIYITHHLLTLGYNMHSRLMTPVKETSSFVDMIPLFRKLASQHFQQMLRKHRDMLVGLIVERNGFMGISDEAENEDNNEWSFETLENGFQAIVRHMQSLAVSWKVLSLDMYWKSMGLLVDTVIDRLLTSLLARRMLSGNGSLLVKYFLERLVRRIQDWFAAHTKSETAALPKYILQWTRLQKVLEFLDLAAAENVQRIYTRFSDTWSVSKKKALEVELATVEIDTGRGSCSGGAAGGSTTTLQSSRNAATVVVDGISLGDVVTLIQMRFGTGAVDDFHRHCQLLSSS